MLTESKNITSIEKDLKNYINDQNIMEKNATFNTAFQLDH